MSQYSRQIRYKYSLPEEYVLTDRADLQQKLGKFCKVILISEIAKADLKEVISGAQCVVSDKQYLKAGVPVIPASQSLKDLQKIIEWVRQSEELRQGLVEKALK